MDYEHKDTSIILTLATAEGSLLAKVDEQLSAEFQAIVTRLMEQVKRQRLASLATLPDDDSDLLALVQKAEAL